MGIDQNNDANMKEIVDKYDLNSDRLFSSDEVKDMINDIQNSEPKFALSKKLFLVTGLVVAIVTFASQVTGSIQNQKVDKQFFELKPGSVADPTTIGHRQLDDFDTWNSQRWCGNTGINGPVCGGFTKAMCGRGWVLKRRLNGKKCTAGNKCLRKDCCWERI